MPFSPTWMKLDSYTKRSKSERENQIPHDTNIFGI